MQTRSYPRIVFGNIVNELIIDTATEEYARSMVEFVSRKIWLAQPGDLVVTPRPVREPLKHYVCGLLGLEPDAVRTVTVPCKAIENLAARTLATSAVDELRAFVRGRRDARLFPFALDRPAVQLARVLEVAVDGYANMPGPALLEQVYELNTKSGFRNAAQQLGLPVMLGAACRGLSALVATVSALLERVPRVIVKYDRSSNGYGSLVVDGEERDLEGCLARHVKRYAPQSLDFVVEAHEMLSRVPSIEICVDDAGSRTLYVCDMRCRGNAFRGLVSPPAALDKEVAKALEHVGARYGRYLHEMGYRGVADVDCGVSVTGRLFVTETNLRRTGGTYLDDIARRLAGPRYSSVVWYADMRRGARATLNDAVSQLVRREIAYDRARGSGVVFTADTVQYDSTWRYLILAERHEQARRLESELEQALELEPVMDHAAP